MGTVNFGANGGTLRTGNLIATPDQFTGTGTVVTSTFLGDADFVVATAGDLTKTLGTWNGPGQNIAYQLDLSGSAGITGDLVVGYQNSGSLAIRNGLGVVSSKGYVGYQSGSTGIVSVDGPGSSWTMNSDSSYTNYIGYNGNGTLSITNGGAVTNQGAYIGYEYGSTGAITVDGAGSKWTSKAPLEIGNYGAGSLVITNGGSVTNSTAHIAANGRSAVGSVIVDGAGSTWANTQSLSVGNLGTGSLTITNGGSVTNQQNAYIGYASFSELINGVRVYYPTKGTATVNGAGSKWASGGTLNVGNTVSYALKPVGRLSITDGGSVTAPSVSVHNASTLTTDVGRGSSLRVGTEANNWTGTITNNGTVQLVAGAGAANGTYTPIAYGTMTGTGTVQALGGEWNAATHTVTISDAATALAGETATLDLSTTQRLLVTDAATGDSVGLGFKGSDTPSSLSFSASPAEAAQQAALQSLLASGESVLSAWDFSPGEGYASGDPVYLSLEIGSGLKLTDLAIWHFDDGFWSLFDASDLAYDNLYANFTATGFSSYAVTAPVPVPAAVWLFGSALAGFGVFGRRKAA